MYMILYIHSNVPSSLKFYGAIFYVFRMGLIIIIIRLHESVYIYKRTYWWHETYFWNNFFCLPTFKFYIISVLIATVALSFGVLGEGFSAGSGPWCWIKDCESIQPSPIVWMLITVKAWEIAAYLGISAIYIVLKCQQYCRYRKVGNLFIKILNIELLIEMHH